MLQISALEISSSCKKYRIQTLDIAVTYMIVILFLCSNEFVQQTYKNLHYTYIVLCCVGIVE
jgi:hypothetical protein